MASSDYYSIGMVLVSLIAILNLANVAINIWAKTRRKPPIDVTLQDYVRRSEFDKLREDIQKKITGPIESARDLVDKAVAKIKGFFPIDVGKILDNIRLPKFTVDGGEAPYGIMGKGYPPSFDISWNAKGGVFDGPSIIGVGEAGPEAVVPLSENRLKPLTDAIAEANARNNEQLLNGMYQVFSMALREANFNVTIGRRDFERSLREAGAL